VLAFLFPFSPPTGGANARGSAPQIGGEGP
jgi:hypothetical protein